MPWYEPALRPPPTPHRAGLGEWNDPSRVDNGGGGGGGGGGHGHRHRHGRDDGIVDVENFLTDSCEYYRDRSRAAAPRPEDEARDDSRLLGGRRPNFDGFQHRVESQLAGLFPLADFASAPHGNQFGSRHRPSSSSIGRGESTDDGSNNPVGGWDDRLHGRGRSQNVNPNLKSEDGGSGGGGTVLSKAAQFFHPRPVMALMPYRDFFSPMQFPDDAMGGPSVVDGRKPASDAIDNLGSDGMWNAAQNESSLHGQLGQVDQENGRQMQPRTPADDRAKEPCLTLDEPSRDPVAGSGPAYGLKPKDLFDATRPSPRNPFKRPPKQAKLLRDSRTGEVSAGLDSALEGRPRARRSATSWDGYGGRDAGANDERGEEKERAKEKKKKEKKKKSKEKRQSKKSGADIGELLAQGKKRPSGYSGQVDGANDEESKAGKVRGTDVGELLSKGKKRLSTATVEGDGANNDKRESEKTKPKKRRRDRSLHGSVTELAIPSYDEEEAVTGISLDEGALLKLSERDFDGISQMEMRNAGQCLEGLRQFLVLVGQQEHVSFTMLFLDRYTGNYITSAPGGGDGDGDGVLVGGGGKKRKKKVARSGKFAQPSKAGYELTTPFLPTSKSYCTAKGPKCTAWNCTCDDQVRAMRASATLLGAMFVFQNGGGGGPDGDNGDGGEWECYLLPLGPTKSDSEEVEFPRMISWPIIPFHCDVSLSDRWSAFEALLLNESTKLVTYNATVTLLPFYHHLSHDVADQTHCGGPTCSQFAACIAGAGLDEQGQTQFSLGKNNGYLSSVWDMRLVSWMLRPHATDAELEFTTFREGFAHLAPNQRAKTSDMPILTQGLAEANANLQLLHSLYPIMNKQLLDGGLLDALVCIEAPVQSILASMESRGVGFYPDRLKKMEQDIESRIEQLEDQARSITKDPDFLLSSPQQVSAFLFDVLKVNIPAGLVSKTKAGSSHRSTSEEALRAIKAETKSSTGSSPQIIDIILEFRGLNKLLTTYVRPLPNACRRVRSKNLSRIYPQWMQTAVRTGRLSCRKPNLQQIPNEGAFGVTPRSAFATKRGMCLFTCDYSQKEVRILAHISEDDALLSLFRGDPKVDIYKQMSSLIRNKPVDAITDTERAQFKQVTLAILYGMSANQVAKKLSISKAYAQQMMNDFFKRFRRLKTWMDETKDFARRNLYVKTIAGRKRYLDDINSNDHGKKSQAERQAINSVIQGSAADLMKAAMINMAANLMRWRDADPNSGNSTRPRMILQIHDEVILEVQYKKNDINRLFAIAQKSCSRDCEDYFGLKVPLLLKCSVGFSWGALVEIKDKI